MSKPKSTYVVYMLSMFYFQPHFHFHESYNMIKSAALVFCTFCRISLDGNVDEENKMSNN